MNIALNAIYSESAGCVHRKLLAKTPQQVHCLIIFQFLYLQKGELCPIHLRYQYVPIFMNHILIVFVADISSVIAIQCIAFLHFL